MFANAHRFLFEFLSSSTVHGLNYFGDRRRHWLERVFWIIVFVVSMSVCLFMVHETYEKWQSSPIIVTQDDVFTSISEVPFPAVTVCPAAKINSNWSINLGSTYEIVVHTAFGMIFSSPDALGRFKFNEVQLAAMNLSEKDLLLLEAVSHICPEAYNAANFLNDQLDPFEAEKIIKTHALGLDDIFHYQSLKGESKADLFEAVFTEEGICYTFNGLKNFDIFKKNSIAKNFRPFDSETDSVDWNSEDGYKPTEVQTLVPRPAFSSNPQDGLLMTLFQDDDLSATGCPWGQEKFKIVIHSPADFPRVGHKFISIPRNQELMIKVKPVMMTTSPELTKYPVDTRQCYFNSDRSLKFFKYYSQSNCEFECVTNFTLLACDCVRVTMPRDNVTKVCMQEDRNCIGGSDSLFHMKSLNDVKDWKIESLKNNYGFSFEKIQNLLQHSCDCLPPCISLNYEITTLALLLNNQEEMENNQESTDSDVMIYFEDSEFLKTKRSEIYGWGDFIANCGGLLGLFMGVSILSIIEIIYFATLRLACTLKSPDNKVEDEESAIENSETSVFPIPSNLELIDWDKF